MEWVMNEDQNFSCKVNKITRVPVKVNGEKWEADWKFKHHIDFGKFELPTVVITSAKEYLRKRLSSVGPNSIDSAKNMLGRLSLLWNKGWFDFSNMKLVDWMRLWNYEPIAGRRVARLEIKKFYKFCSDHSIAGADDFVAVEISSWIADIDDGHYRDLLSWHEERGAMTTTEQEIFRRNLHEEVENETVREHFTRVFLWVCLETLKRPTQISGMSADALVKIQAHDGDVQYFLRIPKAKRQQGRKPELWPITNSLASEIIGYSAYLEVSSAQKQFNSLFVGDGLHKSRPKYNISAYTQRWVVSRNIVSPRTRKHLVITPYRVRHTGATALAMHGTPLREIQYILEHDSPSSSQVYIDVIGSELAPLLGKIDRKTGYIFSGLNEEFFKGSVQGYLLDKKILIPVVDVPAVVGSCGFNGRCDKHPFFQCYNGCKYFIAWKDADHSRSLAYIENELARWEAAEGLHERSKAIKDFERIKVAITDVIHRVASDYARHD